MEHGQNLLELLDLYSRHIDEQDETIRKLKSIAEKQACEIRNLETIAGCERMSPPVDLDQIGRNGAGMESLDSTEGRI